ncbi:arrestin domain-containing protein 17-like isoform X2 [Periplaneta americana]|uniref:arrestin domain-containing protein 17-like isoform X2 n=1 Tax=Periplaneta americana TaxID=6978 RepID=UPI0037E97A81
MGLINLNIIFDNPQNIYFCGQTVSGRLLVNTDSPKKLRSIVIKFKGEAECHWSETRTVRRNGRNHTHTVHYRGHELYFDNRVKLFGGSGDTETLPPGEHSFQFSMILPIHLPSSFEGSHGFVRYTVKAILDRPWKFDHEVKNAFTVLSHLDLNLDPRNREPFKVEDSKHFCCCCCKSGPLTLVTVIPARGFVPGQSIPLTVEVDNASNVNIYEVVCELQKIVTYHSTSPQRKIKKDHVDVCRMNLDGSVAEGDSKTWAAKMNIPALPPSGLLKCSIIDIEYLLKRHQRMKNVYLALRVLVILRIASMCLGYRATIHVIQLTHCKLSLHLIQKVAVPLQNIKVIPCNNTRKYKLSVTKENIFLSSNMEFCPRHILKIGYWICI